MSRGVEWALHSTVVLSFLESGRTGSRKRLAEYSDLPDAYLAKHLKSLERAGVLTATSGPQGGFKLARSADQISVLDIVEAVDGARAAFVCEEIRQQGLAALPPEQCKRACSVASVMYKADKAWRDSLRAVTIADLAAKVPAAQRQRGRMIMAGTDSAAE